MYLGSQVIPFNRYDGTKTEKTVVYFSATFEAPYHAQFTDTKAEKEGLAWLAPSDAKRLLEVQPWGEETIIDRFNAYRSNQI